MQKQPLATLLKQRLQHRCFPVRQPFKDSFLIAHLRWMLRIPPPDTYTYPKFRGKSANNRDNNFGTNVQRELGNKMKIVGNY